MTQANFLKATQGAPAWPTLLTALQAWDGPAGLAVDLGCGAGRDSLELLRQGWRVQAVDADPQALMHLLSQVDEASRQRLETTCESFETLALPRADLVNGAFSLPFCEPTAYPEFWTRISGALGQGGLFAGHYFGERDDWAAGKLTILSRQALLEQFAGWELIEFEEAEFDGKTAVGRCKHWHLFSVVARRL
ncbi:hypothetical protein D9M68_720710 [compost metagenome]